jgi:hypothetical protein
MIKDAYGNTRFFGVYRGVVITATPEGVLTLKVPQVLANEVTGPALPVANVSAAIPAEGEGVWVVFEGGDPSYPLWLSKFSPDIISSTSPGVLVPQVEPRTDMFTVFGGTAGTQPTFNGDPKFTGTFIKTGALVHFEVYVEMSNITSFGTGQYYVDLPFVSKNSHQFGSGCLHDESTGVEYPIFGHVQSGESRLWLQSLDSQGNSSYNVDFTYNRPITLATADRFHISGSYIAA